ncbi:MAG: recombination regulator RecX [Chromatiaceae bacterium]|nr:recombination regulator RecX [Chromatiaceae bacterium]
MTLDAELRRDAIALLARREHSRRELARKLAARGYEPTEVDGVLDELCTRGLLSDARMAEVYVAERLQKGFGPLRLRQELHERGVADELVDPLLEQDPQDWLARMAQVSAKKFGAGRPADAKEWTRRARFLQYRGFPPELVARFLRTREDD